MRSGGIDRIIALQRVTTTQSPSGEEEESWATFFTLHARYEALQGDERFQADQFVARNQVAFTIRWSHTVADVSPLDRIIYPASVLADSPTSPLRNKIYDIIAVQEVGRHEALRLITAVRQDETQ